MLNWTCSHLCLWKISIFWTTGCNFENYHLGDSASRLLGSVTVKLDNLILKLGGGRKQAYCRIDYRNYVSALFQANFPRNICNISFRVFYVFFCKRAVLLFLIKTWCCEETGNKISLSPNFFIFWQIDVFWHGGGRRKGWTKFAFSLRWAEDCKKKVHLVHLVIKEYQKFIKKYPRTQALD